LGASLLGPFPVFDVYLRSASDMILKQLLDVRAESASIFLSKPFKFGLQGKLDR
jgi:hypothetical protein